MVARNDDLWPAYIYIYKTLKPKEQRQREKERRCKKPSSPEAGLPPPLQLDQFRQMI